MSKSNLMLFLSFLFIFFSKTSCIAGYDDGVSVYMYDRIPGCGCFLHCKCFKHWISSQNAPGGFPSDSKWHPSYIEDKIWHEFMKKYLLARKTAAFLDNDQYSVRKLVEASNYCGFACLLSEYLNAVDKLEKEIESSMIANIEAWKQIYKNPADNEKLQSHINRYTEQANNAYEILTTIPETIIPLYKTLLKECPHCESYNMVPTYNRGLIALLEGNTDESLFEIGKFISLAIENNEQNLLTSEMFQKQGEAFLDVGLYHQAIESLSRAISKDPKNLESYFLRASAYFEIGNFDSSLEDYIKSEKSSRVIQKTSASKEFITAFTQSAVAGAYDSTCDFVPSFCYSMYGLRECLWTVASHPIQTLYNLAHCSKVMGDTAVEYFKTLDKEKYQECVTELVHLYENYNNLSDKDKGELIGYTIGRYGVEIFAGSATIKGYSAFKQLQEANRICNLEAMALSIANKDKIASKALQQYAERCNFFEKIEIHWGHQNKHIPGKHNFVEGSSILTHENANHLLKRKAGQGKPTRGEMGKPGYKEVVDFKENIGIWVNNENTCSLPTNKGTIHYGKKSAHIVPAHPEAEAW